MPILTFTTGYEDASIANVKKHAEEGYLLACIEIAQRSLINQKCKDFSDQQARNALTYILSVGDKYSLHYNIAIAFQIMLSFFDRDFQKVIELHSSIQNLSDLLVGQKTPQNDKIIKEINDIKIVIEDYYSKAVQSLKKQQSAKEQESNKRQTTDYPTYFAKFKYLGDLCTDNKQKHKYYRQAYEYYYRAMLLSENGVTVYLKVELDNLKKCMTNSKYFDRNMFYICYCIYQYHTVYGSEINQIINITEIEKMLFERNLFDTERLIQLIDYCWINKIISIHDTLKALDRLKALLQKEPAANIYYIDKIVHTELRIALNVNNTAAAKINLNQLSINYIQVSHKDIIASELPQEEKNYFLYECFQWYSKKIKSLQKTLTDNFSTHTLKFDLPYYKSIQRACGLLMEIGPEFKQYKLDEINYFVTLIDVNQFPNLYTKLCLLDKIITALTSKNSADQSYSTLDSLTHLRDDLNNTLTHVKSFISTTIDNLGEFIRSTTRQASTTTLNPFSLFSTSVLSQRQLRIISNIIEDISQIKNDYDTQIIMPNRENDSKILEEYIRYNDVLNQLAEKIEQIKQLSSNADLIKICNELLKIKTKVVQKIQNDKSLQTENVNRQKK